jgi:hypothetical protein
VKPLTLKGRIKRDRGSSSDDKNDPHGPSGTGNVVAQQGLLTGGDGAFGDNGKERQLAKSGQASGVSGVPDAPLPGVALACPAEPCQA